MHVQIDEWHMHECSRVPRFLENRRAAPKSGDLMGQDRILYCVSVFQDVRDAAGAGRAGPQNSKPRSLLDGILRSIW